MLLCIGAFHAEQIGNLVRNENVVIKCGSCLKRVMSSTLFSVRSLQRLLKSVVYNYVRVLLSWIVDSGGVSGFIESGRAGVKKSSDL